MRTTLSAVYENGVLRPLGPVNLKEHECVQVTIVTPSDDPLDEFLDHEFHAALEAMPEEEAPPIEEVWKALSVIPGNLSDDIRAEREARG